MKSFLILCTGLEFDDLFDLCTAAVTTGAFEFFHPCNAYSTGGMMSNATLDKYYHIRNFEVYGMQ